MAASVRLRPLFACLAWAAALGAAPAQDGPPPRGVEADVVVASQGEVRGVYGLRAWLMVHADGAWRVAEGVGPRAVAESGAVRFDVPDAAWAGADSVAVVPEAGSAFVRVVPVPPGAVRVRGRWLRTDLAARAPVTDGAVGRLRTTVPRAFGVVVRTATLAHEFVTARYGAAPPFRLPPVRVEIGDGGGFVFQAFDPDALGGTEIELNGARTVTPRVVAHEYGHYVMFRMVGGSRLRYVLRQKSLREGWAVFFSAAVRAYAAAQYGDDPTGASDAERAPFGHASGAPRYRGMEYGQAEPHYAAIGALLWSLYDVPGPTPFEPRALLGDNDDLGLGLAVFEAVRLAPARLGRRVGVAGVLDQLGAHDGVAAMADHFLCPAAPACDFAAAPDARPSTGTPALPPVRPLVAVTREGGAAVVRWDRRAYPAGLPWANAPAGYRVLRDGAEVAVLGPEAEVWVDVAGPPGAVYTVRPVPAAP